ncbi:MAG: AAA family ATPase [Chloroflexota bacterium]|nr:AAA family ATPase [Chloroflexota bacterium]
MNSEAVPFPFVPAAPDWSVEWERIVERFAWVRTMAGVPQDARHHAEGDVLVHTRMVVDVLAEQTAWRTAPDGERVALFAAALLHDVAKPVCTQIDADGTITSRNHARRGELLARRILYEGIGLDAPVPFTLREQIAKPVRYHGLPLWFFEKPDPVRAVIEASQTASLRAVVLLAEADVRGRMCDDQTVLLDRIAYFREFCIENRCWEGARDLPSDHSRFLYFAGRHANPDYAAYDDTVCEVVLMAGIPGAGKDTWIARNLPDWPVVSLDAIRADLGVRPTEEQGHVIQEAKERARALLRKEQSFVWNATNITRMMRRQLIDLFASYRARIRIVYIEVPFATLLMRNQARAAGLPENALERLIGKLEVPDRTEAHDVAYVIE